MEAIIETGGKQRLVKKGDIIDVELLHKEEGEQVSFPNVYYVNDGKKVTVGTPLVDGYSVKGNVLGLSKGPKVKSIRFKQRHGHNTKFGHRQHYSRVEITTISKKTVKKKKEEGEESGS